MSDFTMTLGNFEAVPEETENDNFATSIYGIGHTGVLIARCNQNGHYPEHARAILEGLNGKKAGLDEITRLRTALFLIAHTETEDSHGNSKDMPSNYYRQIARDTIAGDPTPVSSSGGSV